MSSWDRSNPGSERTSCSSISPSRSFSRCTNVYSHLVYTIKASHVSTVLVEGKVLMRDREILTADVEEILRHTVAWREKILAGLN